MALLATVEQKKRAWGPTADNGALTYGVLADGNEDRHGGRHGRRRGALAGARETGPSGHDSTRDLHGMKEDGTGISP